VSAVEAVDGASVVVPAAGRADRQLEGLYGRHSDRVLRFCRRHLRSQQEAEDAVQTTFLHALRALRRGVVPVSEAAWLFKIAENVCLSAHRSNGRRSEREVFGGELVELAPAVEQQGDVLVGLEAALATIPEGQRCAFVLRELRGMSYREIASEIGTSVAAVETLIFRARRSVARALDAGAGLKGRVAGLLDVGAVVNTLKTLLGGTAVAKVAAVAAVVAVTAVPVSDSVKPSKRERPPLVVTDASQLPVTRSAAAKSEPRKPGSTPRRGDPVSRRHRPGLTEATGANVRTGRPHPESAVDQPRPDQDTSKPVSPTAPAPPPVAPTAPAPVTPPITAPIAPPPVPPISVPEVPPVSLPTLPELPPLPVELEDVVEELPQLPKLP
jgi:RNA polymerase sigma-70 factor (ECF subfamily)